MADRENHQNQQQDVDALETLFAEARATRPDAVPDGLMSSITAAAAAEQALRATPTPGPAAANRNRSPLGLLLAALGGWPAVGGLVAASCTGLWIGVAGPEALLGAPGLDSLAASATVSADYAAYETFDLASVLAEDVQ
jgi:hypothetical protein